MCEEMEGGEGGLFQIEMYDQKMEIRANGRAEFSRSSALPDVKLISSAAVDYLR